MNSLKMTQIDRLLATKIAPPLLLLLSPPLYSEAED